MTVLADHPPVVTTAPPLERTTVAVLLSERLAALGERLHHDGLEAHREALLLLADAVRPASAAVADVLTGSYIAPMRERAFARAVRLVLLRPAHHADLALALAP